MQGKISLLLSSCKMIEADYYSPEKKNRNTIKMSIFITSKTFLYGPMNQVPSQQPQQQHTLTTCRHRN